MEKKKLPKTVTCVIALMICAAFLSLSGLAILYRVDNKYTAKTEMVQEYVSLLPVSGTAFLVDGWEFYPDRLLTPGDFSVQTPSPRYTVWAGEYPNLALFHTDGNPYGAATYRLRLKGEGMMSLYLQEPLCAARVFVDGKDLGGSGSVGGADVIGGTGSTDMAHGAAGGYRPFIRDTVYSFPVDGEAELIIQTANYSHYYGGLWFPPMVGSTDSVVHMAASRMIFYGILCFSALALALFCVVFWFWRKGRRDPAAFWFGLLCLTFSLRVCYPFLHLWGVPFVRPLYALEDAAALCGVYCAVRISLYLFLPDSEHQRLNRLIQNAAATFSLGMCGVGVLVPLLVLPSFPGFMLWYGPLISGYQILAALFLIAAAACGCVLGKPYSCPALMAVTANGVCLLYGAVTVGRFEPAVGGWPEEYGAFCMVLAFAALMVSRSRAMAAENLRLTEHLQEEVDEKTRHLTKLLKERGQLMAELGHDMKSPLTALSNMAQIIRLNDIMLDGDTREKMQGIEDKCSVLADRLESIQELAGEAGALPQMEPLSLNRFLADFYRSNQPVVELTGPDFLCELTPLPCTVMADSRKLTRALENLVFNAGEFTPPDGKIVLSLKREQNFALICVADTGCGIPEAEIPKVFDRLYTTREDEGGQGLGLSITRAIVLEHGGEISVESVVGGGSTFVIRLPLIL